MLRTRGKRVVAEATIPNELVKRLMRSDTELMLKARQVSNLGGFMSGVNNRLSSRFGGESPPRQLHLDPPAAEIDQGNEGASGMEPEAAVAEQPDLGVEPLDPAVG